MRNLKTIAFAGLIGVFALAGDASACHKKKCACPTTTTVVCAPAPVVECVPAPVVECAPAKKKCCFKMPKMHMPKLGCHKKAECAPVAYETTYGAPTTYASPQGYASPQASGQGM